jgi:hypothetical protein
VKVSGRKASPEIRLVLLALILLVAGALVYVFDRGGTVYFLPAWMAGHSQITVFGATADYLPTFVHTLAFILITAAILRPWPQLLPATCAGWFGVECLFEIGQMAPFDGHIAAALPAWFESFPVLDITAVYFLDGTHDPLDIVSIGLGSLVAYLLVRNIQWGEGR